MDFALSDEQGLLAESLRRFLEKECPVTRVRELVADEAGRDGGTWKALCERYDTHQLMDLVFTVGQYNLVSMALNTLGVQLDEGIEGFPQ